MKSKPALLLLTLCLTCTLANHAFSGSIKHYPDPLPAPAFAVGDIKGDLHQLADYRGKVLVLNFWATWCPPCVKEMPSLQRAWELLKPDNIVVLGVNVGEKPNRIKRFLKIWPVDFPILLDGDSKMMVDWEVPAMPTTFIVDSRGHIVSRMIGEFQWDSPELLEQIRSVK